MYKDEELNSILQSQTVNQSNKSLTLQKSQVSFKNDLSEGYLQSKTKQQRSISSNRDQQQQQYQSKKDLLQNISEKKINNENDKNKKNQILQRSQTMAFMHSQKSLKNEIKEELQKEDQDESIFNRIKRGQFLQQKIAPDQIDTILGKRKGCLSVNLVDSLISSSLNTGKNLQKDEIIINILKQDFKDKFDYAVITEFIMNFPFFKNKSSDLGNKEYHKLSKELQYEFFAPGQTIFAIGSQGTKIYLIIKGSVGIQVPIEVEVVDQKGNKQIQTKRIEIAIRKSNEVVGELALETNNPRTATVYAKENTYLASIKGITYKKIVKSSKMAEALNKKLNFLKNLEMFSQIPRRALSSMQFYFSEQNYTRNQCIYKVNDKSDYIYFIKNGEVRLCIDQIFFLEKKADHNEEKVRLDLLQQRNLLKKDIVIGFLQNNEIFGYEVLGGKEDEEAERRKYSVYCNSQVLNVLVMSRLDLLKKTSTQTKQILQHYKEAKEKQKQQNFSKVIQTITQNNHLYFGEHYEKNFSLIKESEKNLKQQFQEENIISMAATQKQNKQTPNFKQNMKKTENQNMSNQVQSVFWQKIDKINTKKCYEYDWKRDALLEKYISQIKENQTLGFSYEFKNLINYMRNGKNEHLKVIGRLKELNQLEDQRFDVMNQKRLLRQKQSQKYKQQLLQQGKIWQSPYLRFQDYSFDKFTQTSEQKSQKNNSNTSLRDLIFFHQNIQDDESIQLKNASSKSYLKIHRGKYLCKRRQNQNFQQNS